MKRAPVIFLQINEVNFDLVLHYVRKYDDLPAFRRMLATFHSLETRGEEAYENLEPWIQWVSAQTGKTYAEHGVFRLGDVVRAPETLVQIFEFLEGEGFRVGAISPMNARNRLKHPAYFVPDPWTETPSDDSGFARRFTRMLRQTVNENATGRISVTSLLAIAEAVLVSFSAHRTWQLLAAIAATRRKPWTKSLVLDQLIHLVHMRLWARERPDVSFLFLNAGAHVQHHYLFNAEPVRGRSTNPAWYVPENADPVRDMLKFYDQVLADYMRLQAKGARLLVATGLTQVPYDRVKFYYRLKNHHEFLHIVGAAPSRVLPRMTRDFEAHYETDTLARQAATTLASLKLERDGRAVFDEIDVRGECVFATLTYPDEIKHNDALVRSDGSVLAGFGEMVAFVAIKNGMHSTRGFAFVSPNVPEATAWSSPIHVARLFDLTVSAASA